MGWGQISQVESQLYLFDEPPIKSLVTRTQVNLPCWQYSIHIIMHCYWRKVTTFLTALRKITEISILEPFLDSVPFTSSIGWFLAIFVTLINHNYEYNSFQCFQWILLENNKNCRWSWGAWTYNWCHNWRWCWKPPPNFASGIGHFVLEVHL